jgi:hypothetical protein
MMGRFMERQTDSHPEDAPSVPECAWPLPAHPLFGYAFPLCGMTLRPSEDGAMLAAILQAGEGSRVPWWLRIRWR